MRVVDGAERAGETACKPCGVCCLHLPMPAGLVGPAVKPAGGLCPHLGEGECRVYRRRPKACANFRCVWLADATWPERWRPDLCGLLCLRETVNGVSAAAVYEIKPGVLRHPSSAEILAELGRTTSLVVAIDIEKRRELLTFAGHTVSQTADSLVWNVA